MSLNLYNGRRGFMNAKYYRKAADLIRNSMNLIKEKDFARLFELTTIASVRGALGYHLYSAGIPFLKYINYIPKYAFYCAEISEITIPENVLMIESGAFMGSAISKVKVEGIIKKLGERCFSKCSITHLPDFKTYPLNAIPSEMYLDCNELVEAVIPDGVKQIHGFAFSSCKNLKKVVIPTSMKVLRAGCFAYCNNLGFIEYKGTLQEWKDIVKSPSYHDGCGDIMLMCSDQAVMLHSS